jgi:hypothetical protein
MKKIIHRLLWGKIKGEPLPPISIKIGQKPEKQPNFNDWATHIGRQLEQAKRR